MTMIFSYGYTNCNWITLKLSRNQWPRVWWGLGKQDGYELTWV